MSLQTKGLFIIGAKRTPFCKHGGLLRELPASYAFAAAAKDAINSANLDPMLIDHTIIGNVNFLSQCDGGKTPRYSGTYSGVSLDKPALGVNKACASGIQAVITSSVEMLTGGAKMILTGGTENMSALPLLVRNVRFGTTFGAKYFLEDHVKKEVMDSFTGKSFHKMVEDNAKKYGVTREDADEFACQSYSKWKTAEKAKIFDNELTALTVTIKNKEILVDKDELIQQSLSTEQLKPLPAILEQGSVLTTGNCYAPADGASAILLANEESLKGHNLQPLVRVSGWATVGVNPEDFDLGAVGAVRRLLHGQGLKVENVDLFEINETFASQALIILRELKLDPSKVNVSGGVIAVGHPVAATGARMITHLVHQLRHRNLKRAIAASSSGGGQGVAIMIENV
ncbi:3-ketoacyl-CoA thiolase, mitochondrial-like [Hyposmocoma kahamanoa]|uniref:3-ketoacyl-CoA thiolase, mitochondrial-like n=1 Tax=Hyposmocoma kahamanoa TaxID=1477025 RepID=UPI000E6DA4A3|nr:3-ketoacyl-CoA thiolase, mitochondrial-like [Hyposmocoma kahamanoa]